jgi:hypothetical protein
MRRDHEIFASPTDPPLANEGEAPRGRQGDAGVLISAEALRGLPGSRNNARAGACRPPSGACGHVGDTPG